MNRSYSKIRHIQESNILLEQRKMMLMEQSQSHKDSLGKLFDKHWDEVQPTELKLPDDNRNIILNSFNWEIFDEYFKSKGITPPIDVFINGKKIDRKK
jgi:hypothetical protein